MSGRALGKLWPFFHKGELQNSCHYKAFCNGCIKDKLALEPPDLMKEAPKPNSSSRTIEVDVEVEMQDVMAEALEDARSDDGAIKIGSDNKYQ